MDYSTHNKLVAFIWQVADDFLRDVYVRGKYRDVILPFTVLRRLDCLLEPTKKTVLATKNFLKEKGIEGEGRLRKDAGYPFYNTSLFTFQSLLAEPSKIKENFESYLNGYSSNIQDIIDKFKLRNQLDTMHEAGILFGVVEKFCSKEINFSPEPVLNREGEIVHAGLTNLGMGYVFEELIRRFNEENNEEAGEHFTPREIIQLMTHLVFLPVKEQIKEGTHLIYDPACGSGGMLTESEFFVRDSEGLIQSEAQIHLYGQEINPETYAICKADIMLKEDKPDVEGIAFGSTLQLDKFPDLKFDFMLTNPPYGKSWKNDQSYIVGEKGEIIDPRFKVGVPRSSDGQLLFLVNMLSKMKETERGSRIASIHNGSALFTGDAGSGESNIRQWILENDWLEAIIQLPKNIFYNTGITTYIWLLSNRKAAHRRGKVQLINASELYEKMRKSLGSKSCLLSPAQIEIITQLYLEFRETEISKIFDNADFGYAKITVERPLRLAAQITDEAIASLRFSEKFRDLMVYAYEKYGERVYRDLEGLRKPLEAHFKQAEISLSSAEKKKFFEPALWQGQLNLMNIVKQLQSVVSGYFDDFNVFQVEIDKALKKLSLKLDNVEKKAFLNAVSWREESAKPVVKKQGGGKVVYEADSELRDSENVPLKEDIQAYFAREVLPYVGDAWIDESKTVRGYEINFNRYFYEPQALRTLAEIRADILALEQETDGLLNQIIQD